MGVVLHSLCMSGILKGNGMLRTTVSPLGDRFNILRLGKSYEHKLS